MSAADGDVVLEVNDLHVTYHPSDGVAIPAVVGVTFELHAGEIVGLVEGVRFSV
jgi:ABC-type glutathione transport system ATPase component